MNDQQQPKLYRQQIEELEQQRLAAVAKSDADFNNPAWLQQALELEHDAAVLARKQHNAIAGAYETLYIESQQMASDLAAARAEVKLLQTTLQAVLEVAKIAAYYMPGELKENQQAVLDAIQQASAALSPTEPTD